MRFRSVSTTRELARLAVTLPCGVLAAYLGRESARHRSAARWAKELEVQLCSIDAFADSLADESRDELRVAFGRRAFLSAGRTDPA